MARLGVTHPPLLRAFAGALVEHGPCASPLVLANVLHGSGTLNEPYFTS